MRSVITLQLGHYSNFVGAHFWNIQEAGRRASSGGVEHDVLYREAAAGGGVEQFTPRLVSVDLKGALGTLPVHDLDVQERLDNVDSLWSGQIAIEKEEGCHKRSRLDDEDKDVCEEEEEEGKPADDDEFPRKTTTKQRKRLLYDVDDGQVNLWSDYLRTRYHPRTNVVVEEYWHGDSFANPFDVLGIGCAGESFDMIEDSVRFFAEESDYLGGFQLLVDGDTGFGGLGVKAAELLAEEYSTKSVLSFPCTPSLPDAGPQRIGSTAAGATFFLNSALSLNGLCRGSTIVSPMSVLKDTFPLLKTGTDHVRRFRNVVYRGQHHYHSSAVLAANLDVLTLPWRSSRRTTTPLTDMVDVASKLNFGGRKLASVAVCCPVPISGDRGGHLVDLLERLESSGNDLTNLATSLTPGCHNVASDSVDVQCVSIRGIDPELNLKPKSSSSAATSTYATFDSAGSALSAHFEKRRPSATSSLFALPHPLPTTRPFPRIFDASKLGRTGHLSAENPAGRVDSVPIMSLWQSSEEGIGKTISTYVDRLAKVNLNKMPRFQEAGLESDELVQNVEELRTLLDCYNKKHHVF